jgi:hypothetical protein
MPDSVSTKRSVALLKMRRTPQEPGLLLTNRTCRQHGVYGTDVIGKNHTPDKHAMQRYDSSLTPN